MPGHLISVLLERHWKRKTKKAGQSLGHLSCKALIDSYTGLGWYKGNASAGVEVLTINGSPTYGILPLISEDRSTTEKEQFSALSIVGKGQCHESIIWLSRSLPGLDRSRA
jgi:hypothetical protein